jgi:hypothetical protein
MKKGKTSRLVGYKHVKITYGTVNSVELKSIYINIKSWVNPKIELENWERVTSNLGRSIKHTVLESINQKLYNTKFIVDLDLRHSGISYDKKSFMNLEITLFTVNESFDFKDKEIKTSIKKICDSIYMFDFLNNEYFSFHLTKNDKTYSLSE